MNILKTHQLEELLVAHWTRFIDSPRLMAFCLQAVRDHAPDFATFASSAVATKTQISVSRLQPCPTGFLVWVEFTAPVGNNKIAVGTTEFIMSHDGEVSNARTVGNLYSTD